MEEMNMTTGSLSGRINGYKSIIKDYTMITILMDCATCKKKHGRNNQVIVLQGASKAEFHCTFSKKNLTQRKNTVFKNNQYNKCNYQIVAFW